MTGRILGILAIALAIVECLCAATGQGPRFAPARKTGTVETPLITEASGIVASRKNVGVLWVHNDSGDAARIFAINAEGKLLGVCTVTGAQNRDWEDIALGPGPDPNKSYIYIGEIGDNNARYPSVKVHRIPEPNADPVRPFVSQRSAPCETIELTYPDGPRDAETLLVDPLTKDIYVVAKRELFCKVYMAAYPQSTTKATKMTRVALLPWPMATGGDVSSDGRQVIVRGYYNASLWTRQVGEPLWKAFSGPRVDLPVAAEPQGEGICFDANDQGYYTISDGLHPAVYYFERIGDRAGDSLSDIAPTATGSGSKP
jgi:hypothetical protein